ncbi:short-chain dehydrogenase/reductase [Leptospira hartskeerlii]|uniref:Short-chain dehydrogenase/reductase n=1 Tax=Leptospira hartskeerlii TaxID=2023177 RepID=A0A2M9XD71_9LEPT|nr:SDR family NAD(P)-dependent oxidoreductase [Leptospira hartskeerlii]PJZ25647.1 short-chain dehydrogenase/reductase [Leptospira hartskeerlii]PJZ35529.1 short-chain dehydrogenase/reductase [Leptospira hartskeerlii]
MKQTILVTGASSGIGLLIAKTLHENGHTVIGTSRNPKKSQSEVPFKLLPLDISDDNSIGSFGKLLFGEIDRLDVLINNAGYLVKGLAEETSIELGRQQLETNFWGTVKFTNELLPYFRKQRSGKIITIGSFLGLISLPNVSYYSASKHALEGYFKSLRFELNQFNIKVSVVEPMAFKTNIGDNSISAKGTIREYDSFRQKIVEFTKREFDNAPGPEPVVNTILKIVNEKTPKFSYPVGKGASLFLTLQRFAYNTFEGAILKKVNQV